MASESGYSNQKKLGTAQFKTIHNLGSDKYGQSVASKALYEKTPEDVITVTEVVGASGQIEFLNIEYANHNALALDVLRITQGSQLNLELDIISVIDTDNFRVLPLVSAASLTGENGSVMAWVTNKANSDGSQIVTLAPVPLQFVKDTVTVNVNEDTAIPSNNIALPSAAFIYKDGIQVAITKDTATPSNTVGMPVEIVAASGTPINITAGDLNVQLTDQGVNADVTRIGDGTNQLGINATNEALVHDADALTKLTSIDTKLTSPLTTKISDGTDVVDVVPLGTAITNTDKGIVTNSVIHGLTTGGGGGYVDVKVTPSGALTVEVGASALPAGAATETTLGDVKTAVETIAAQPSGNLVPFDHDEIVTTYVGATSRINTVTYKLATVTVATLTMSYDGSDRLTSVVRS